MQKPVATAAVADALVRLKRRPRIAPPGVRTVIPGTRVLGRCVPVRHAGSVDVFLEALEHADRGDVLVIDNGGRMDEGCIGDLTVLEIQDAGLAGVFVWGCHRDSEELGHIRFPVFSYGRWPQGPLAPRKRPADALSAARVGRVRITRGDWIVADDDGAMFLGPEGRDEVLALARDITRRERAQARKVRTGTNLRAQFGFADYLRRRRADPSYTLRAHLRAGGRSIEE